MSNEQKPGDKLIAHAVSVAAAEPASSLQRVGVQISEATGPFPPADLAKEWREFIPDAAERMFAFTEREQAHRHATDNRELQLHELRLKESTRLDWRRMHLALALGVAAIAAVVLVAIFGGKEQTVAIAGGEVLAMAVGAVVHLRRAVSSAK